jgi:hypothetical protein
MSFTTTTYHGIKQVGTPYTMENLLVVELFSRVHVKGKTFLG